MIFDFKRILIAKDCCYVLPRMDYNERQPEDIGPILPKLDAAILDQDIVPPPVSLSFALGHHSIQNFVIFNGGNISPRHLWRRFIPSVPIAVAAAGCFSTWKMGG